MVRTKIVALDEPLPVSAVRHGRTLPLWPRESENSSPQPEDEGQPGRAGETGSSDLCDALAPQPLVTEQCGPQQNCSSR